MHTRFTDEELLTLSEMLTLACWCGFWNHKPGAEDGLARYDNMLEKILQRLQHSGSGEHVELDPDRQRLRLKKDKEDQSFHVQCYDEMRNEIFWEELVIRLAERDLARQHGASYLDSLNEEQRKQAIEPLSKRYWKELSTRGISNFHLISRNGEG